jgi:iron complex outermembrane receptor protein
MITSESRSISVRAAVRPRRLSASIRLCSALVLVSAQAAFAQSMISGVVTDPQSAVVPNARVALLADQTEVRTTRSDAQGRYRFDAVAPGRYVVAVSAPGFQTATTPEITVTAGQGATRNVALAVAGTTETVTVEGVRAADRGYRVGSVSSLGILGAAPILDTPYTVNVLPSDLIANGQVKNLKEAVKYLPMVEFQEMQGSEVLRPATRGMQGSNMQNARMDGMGIVVTGANSMESLEQIEVLSGLGGALYGPANPSGMFNFVPKRPTERPVRRVSLDYDGRSIATGQVDFGGRAGSNERYGYRVNAVGGDGESFVPGSNLTRRMVSAAGDVRPFDCTVIEGFYSAYNLVQRGFPGWFTYGRSNASSTFVMLPGDAPDPARRGYGQADAGVNLTSQIGEVRLRHDFNGNWQLTAGALNQDVRRDITTQVNALTDSDGHYTASLANGFAPRFTVLSNLAHLNGRVATGRVTHELAIGVAGYAFHTHQLVTKPAAATLRLGTASIADPISFGLPAAGLPVGGDQYLSTDTHQQGFSVADNIGLGDGWSVRAAISQDWIWTDNFNNRSVHTRDYSANGVSPLISVMYKPQPRMTLYGTWGSSLQQGDVAPGTAANAGEGLAPYRSHQEEVGYKLAWPAIDFSTAVFRLERPFAYVDPADNVFRITGNQVNYGLEAMVTGRMGARLSTYGGFTVLNPRLTKTAVPETNDKRFVGIPAWKSNLLAEYRLFASRAAFVSADWQLVGRRPIDDLNTAWTPAYTVFDLAGRYAHAIGRAVATWRLTVNNIGDTHYWSTLGPGNITGSNVGSYTAHLGSPRTVALSMEVAF